MSAFDKIIGYDKIKTELMQISDMIHRPDAYAALGARMPKGLLLDGEPGLGKTLMAMALMEDSGLLHRAPLPLGGGVSEDTGGNLRQGSRRRAVHDPFG